MMGVAWLANLVIEGGEVAIFIAILFSFVNTYQKNRQSVLIKLASFSVLMVVFESLLIYLTYFLSTRFGFALASLVLFANTFLIVALYVLLRVVTS